jgi:hypothetical protein
LRPTLHLSPPNPERLRRTWPSGWQASFAPTSTDLYLAGQMGLNQSVRSGRVLGRHGQEPATG